MSWASSFSKLRPTKLAGAAITFVAVTYTVYRFYRIAASGFPSTPPTSSTTPQPATSPQDTISPHKSRGLPSDSHGAARRSSAKPWLADDAAQHTTSFPSLPPLSPAIEASHSTTQVQEQQASGKIGEASETDSDDEEEEHTISSEESDSSDYEVEKGSDQEADDTSPFQQVLDAIDLESLAAVALKTRKACDDPPTTSLIRPYLTGDNISCSVDPNSLAGSYNIVYFINFSDGVKWTARIPGKGPLFNELDVKKMDSDYRTMQYISSSTSIPLPEVFQWSTSSAQIGTPYALMSFVEGSPLSERWFDQNWSTEEKRLKALSGICASMSQLYALRFDKLGSLEFDDASQQYRVGPSFWQEEDFDNPWGATHATGPWESMIDYLMEDWHVMEEEVEGARKADLAVLRLAVESIPSYMRDQGRFHLSHADCNYQNIFVDDDANITGIIDWDGSDTLPCSMGFGRYPSWLTRDWDPGMYDYDEEEDPPYDPNFESPPEELSRYRQHYASEFEKLKLQDYDPRQTRLSHLVEAIKIARNSRMSRDWIVSKLLDHAFEGKLPFKESAFDQAYLAGEAGEMVEQIREAFKNMWHAEWENSPERSWKDAEADDAEDGQEEGQEEDHENAAEGREEGREEGRSVSREKRRNKDADAVPITEKMRSN